MGTLVQLKNTVYDYISGQLTTRLPLLNVKTVLEFSGKSNPMPVRTPTVSVGILAASATSADGYIGENGASTKHGRPISTTVQLAVAVPKYLGGLVAHEIFEVVAEELLEATSLSVSHVECGELDFNKSMDCFMLNARAKISTIMFSEISEELFTDFEVRRYADE